MACLMNSSVETGIAWFIPLAFANAQKKEGVWGILSPALLA
jgi:hypothetical protein